MQADFPAPECPGLWSITIVPWIMDCFEVETEAASGEEVLLSLFLTALRHCCRAGHWHRPRCSVVIFLNGTLQNL